jgi:hypothetical protein
VFPGERFDDVSLERTLTDQAIGEEIDEVIEDKRDKCEYTCTGEKKPSGERTGKEERRAIKRLA